jgi:hypothetical protein
MRPRLIGDLALALYLALTSVPLLMFAAGFLLPAEPGGSLPPVVQLAPMGCVIFFVPAHLAACTVLWLDLLRRRRASGLLWAPALLLGAWLTVPFYYWFRVRPNLAGATKTEPATSQPAA